MDARPNAMEGSVEGLSGLGLRAAESWLELGRGLWTGLGGRSCEARS